MKVKLLVFAVAGMLVVAAAASAAKLDVIYGTAGADTLAGTTGADVIYARAGSEIIAVKELAERPALREYELLRDLDRLGIPAVDPLAVVTGRVDDAGEPLEPVLITRHLGGSMPYRWSSTRARSACTASSPNGSAPGTSCAEIASATSCFVAPASDCSSARVSRRSTARIDGASRRTFAPGICGVRPASMSSRWPRMTLSGR